MDLSQPIIYQGLTAVPPTPQPGGVPMRGYLIRSVDFARVPGDYRADKKPFTDGVTMSDVYLSGRLLTIDAEVYGSSKGDLWDLTEAWLAAYSPSMGSSVFQFSQPTADTGNWPNGLIPLEFEEVQAISQPEHRAITDRDMTHGLMIPVRSHLLAADPLKYVSDGGQIVTVGTSAALLPNRGNAPTTSQIGIEIQSSGPLEIVVSVDLGARGEMLWVAIDFSSATADSYFLNMDGRVRGSGGIATAPVVFSSSRFDRLVPGQKASYGVTSGNAGRVVSVTLTYTEAFY